jgi:mannose-6-phosphate isomerase
MRRVPKPWGYELVFAENERYAGKILHLEAGHSLSLQYHERKDETLYVLKGEVRLSVEVEIEGEKTMREIRLAEGEAFRIRPGVKHRMRADEPVDLVEVSSPELDDVVRLEDAYGRAGTTKPCLFAAAIGLGLGLSLATAAGVFAATGPTPTPTPRPRLSGGFGRTPAPSTGGATGDGQSMADVVKAAGAPKKSDQKGVAITNDSLVKDTNKGRVSTASPAKPAPTPRPGAAAAAAAGSAQPGAAAGAPTPPPTAVGSPNTADEAVWKDRAHRARQRVEDLKAQVATLESESKRLENEFYRWDDGQYRDRVIKPQWDKAREDLETSKRQLTAAEAELADLPEQARKAGALPGWLRE